MTAQHFQTSTAQLPCFKQRCRLTSSDATRQRWLLWLLLLLALLLLATSPGNAASAPRQPQPRPQQHQQQPQQPVYSRLLRKYFPQVQRCGTRWLHEYGRLHADVLAGRLPARHLVSVAVEKGAADRLAGIVTQLYLAALGQRALSEVTHTHLPRLSAACEPRLFAWASPPNKDLPAELVDSLKGHNKGVRTVPRDVDSARFAAVYLVDTVWYPGTRLDAPQLKFFHSANLSELPTGAPDTPFLLWTSNRGRTHAMAHNPHHRRQFAQWGVLPDDAFMCGFFALCGQPSAPLVAYYQRYWDALRAPGQLSIGVQVRVGDAVFSDGEGELTQARLDAALAAAAPWLECAARIEAAKAAPGQRVVWFLNSDSLALRKAAKAKYGAKVITDNELAMVHPDCSSVNPEACDESVMNASMVHSVGSILTFALTDYQVVSARSGFGRLGAWLSGRWDSTWELGLAWWDCDPANPMPRKEGAAHFSGV